MVSQTLGCDPHPPHIAASHETKRYKSTKKKQETTTKMANLNTTQGKEETVPKCCCCGVRDGLSLVMLFWIILFGLLVYAAFRTQNPMLPFYDFGLTILMIIVGSYGLVKEKPQWIMGFGLLYFFSTLFSLGISIFQKGYRSPVLNALPNGIDPPPVLVVSTSMLINACILWAIYAYYKFLMRRKANVSNT
jgi:hypothetical protein